MTLLKCNSNTLHSKNSNKANFSTAPRSEKCQGSERPKSSKKGTKKRKSLNCWRLSGQSKCQHRFKVTKGKRYAPFWNGLDFLCQNPTRIKNGLFSQFGEVTLSKSKYYRQPFGLRHKGHKKKPHKNCQYCRPSTKIRFLILVGVSPAWKDLLVDFIVVVY